MTGRSHRRRCRRATIRWGRSVRKLREDPAARDVDDDRDRAACRAGACSLPDTVLATAKHFVGDGGTVFGTGNNPGGTPVDRGDDQMTDAALRAIHLAPYRQRDRRAA